MEGENKKQSYGIWSLVLGIISIVLFLNVSWLALLTSIAGIVLGVLGVSNGKKGISIAGLICSAIPALIFFVMMLIVIAGSGTYTPDTENNSEGIVSEKTDPDSDEMPKYDKEILFRDIPWGTNYTEVDEMLGELNLWALSGESFRTFSTDEIILGDYQGIDFDYNDINIIANAYNGEVDVAGYTTRDVVLYFSYIPVDGILTKTEEDSALYGARYEFDTQNLNAMSSDLVSKLTSLYGEPSKTTSKSDIYKNEYTYTYWYGANDTVIVLKTQNTEKDTTNLYEDEIIISYVWLKGDELLQNASDLLKEEAIQKEEDVYGNDSTGGL